MVNDPVVQLSTAFAGRYRVERELGQGGMATVYVAEDLKHHRKVAIKILRPEFGAALGAQRFLREIEIAANLTHPNIVPVYDSGSLEVEGWTADRARTTATSRPTVQFPPSNLLYYVMPYIAGESLRQKLAREGALPVAEAARLLRDVANALSRAHRSGVVHRDIKPENILIDDGHAVVMDFGIARAVSDIAGHTTLTQAGTVVGTPAYMAPEQVAADPNVDARADIYALGVVGYEMLTGQPPFSGSNTQQLLAAQVTRTPDPITIHRATVPPAFAELIMGALAKHPADRPQHASDLLPVLDAAALNLTTPGGGFARPPTTTPPRARYVMTGIAGIVLATAAFMLTRHGSRSETIAVMPCRNFAGDTSHAHYGEGVATEIMVGLTHVGPTLSVIGATSSFSINLDSTDIPTAARKLGATAILVCTMRWAGDSVHVNAELHDRSDHLIWAEAYQRASGSLSAIENDVAHAIVDSLRLRLAPGQTLVANATENPAAHRLYLAGVALALKSDEANIRQAVDSLRRAVDLDPHYAAAWATLATAYGELADAYSAPLDMLPHIRTAAQHAIDADSLSADAHQVRGAMFTWDWDFAAERRELQLALQLDPRSPNAHFQMGSFLLVVDSDVVGARAELYKAALLDPLSPWTTWIESVAAGAARDSAADLALANEVLRIDPRFFYGIDPLASAYARWGRWTDCVSRYRSLPPDVTAQPVGRYAECLAHTGDTLRAQSIMDSLKAGAARRYVDATKIARIALALGQRDSAFAWLERAYHDRSGDLLFITLDPAYATVRTDPRFRDLARRIGLPWAVR